MNEFYNPPETPVEASSDSESEFNPQPRRKPGRPRRDESRDGSPKPDTAKDTKPGPSPKRRKKSAPTSDDISQRAQLLAGIHYTIAMFTGIPEIQLRQEEAFSLAGASLNFEAEFGFEIDTKVTAAATLIGTMGALYIPRFMMFAKRKQEEKRRAEANDLAGNGPNAINPQGNVHPFNPAAE